MKKALQKALPLSIKHNIIPLILCSEGLYSTLQTTHLLDLKIYLFMCSCICSLANESDRISCEWLNRTESKHISFYGGNKSGDYNECCFLWDDRLYKLNNKYQRKTCDITVRWMTIWTQCISSNTSEKCLQYKKGGGETSAAKTKRPIWQG